MRVTHFLVDGPIYKNKLWAFKDFSRIEWTEDENGGISTEEAMRRIEIWNRSSPNHFYSLCDSELFVENTLDFS
jgi:hypothetical protein